jgi:ABC-type phosphate/phosphonate transport system substrate-binding protein
MVFLGLAVGAAAALATGRAAERDKADSGVVLVGMMRSYFPETPEVVIPALMRPFKSLIETQIGMKGDLTAVARPEELGQQITEGKRHAGIFHGYEFAWARQKFPQLRTLVTAVNERPLYAYVVVHRDNAAAGFADLKGKSLAQARTTRSYCRLFVDRRCKECDQEPASYFSEILTPGDIEESLEEVVDGKAQAAVVDAISLALFQQRKPGRYERLKKVAESELFPAAVIAYRPGILAEATLRRLRDGLINANQTRRGQQLLQLSRLTGFELAPAEYEKQLAAIFKAYPPAEAKEPSRPVGSR